MKRRTRQKELAKLRRRQKVRRRANVVERVVDAINSPTITQTAGAAYTIPVPSPVTFVP